MEQEQVSETVFLDVFTSLKGNKQQSYIMLRDFVDACRKYKPQCIDGFFEDDEGLEQLCDTMFSNMIEASKVVVEPTFGNTNENEELNGTQTISSKRTSKKKPPP